MSYLRIWVHLVWSTKNRQPFLEETIRRQVLDHLRNYALSKNIFIDHINGHVDHIHCLISLGAEQNIEKVVQLLKGESSFWINKNRLTKLKFAWQNEYFATSVAHSQVDLLRSYIRDQEKHHQINSFQKEFEAFIIKYNFKNVT